MQMWQRSRIHLCGRACLCRCGSVGQVEPAQPAQPDQPAQSANLSSEARPTAVMLNIIYVQRLSSAALSCINQGFFTHSKHTLTVWILQGRERHLGAGGDSCKHCLPFEHTNTHTHNHTQTHIHTVWCFQGHERHLGAGGNSSGDALLPQP